GPGEPLQPLAFQQQLRLVEVERGVMEQLKRALVRGLELGFADELHLPRRLERPIEETAAPIPSEVGRERGADLHDRAMRAPHELQLVYHLPDADTGHVAELRLEPRPQVEVLRA